MAALNHPSIVTLFSIEEAEGVRFLTMELVGGQTLDLPDLLERDCAPRVLDIARRWPTRSPPRTPRASCIAT